MTVLSIDIETYSDLDLGKVGVYKYVDSPYFKVLLFAYAIDDGSVEVIDIENGQEIPQKVIDLIFDKTVTKSAFNAQFERVCLNKYFGKDTSNWECSMIKAWSCGINGGLASVGDAIGLAEDEQKMKEGKRLIKKFCTPQKAKQNSFFNDSDWNTFIEYCRRDVEVEMKIRKKLEKFYTPDWEWGLYQLDQKINDNGIRLDLEMVNNAIKIDDDLVFRMTKRFKELTGLDNPNSLKDIKNFIKDKTGESIKSITKGNLSDLQKQFKYYPEVLEVLKIRALLSKTSTAKYRMMKDIVLEDGRSRGNIQFYGATRTGRWAGRLIQVHNLPRNHISDLNTAREIIKHDDYDLLSMCYDDPPDILSQCLRTTIIPEDGKKFMVADFSAIEARVIAWFADDEWVLDVFRTTGKIYEATAARMFNVPIESIGKHSDMRQRGKVATLALGYQGGPGALISMGALKMGIPEDDLPGIVSAWREANNKIVSFWYETDRAVKKAIKETTSVKFANGKLRAFFLSGILWIELPSGRRLAYAKPQIVPHDKWENAEKIIYRERNSAGTGWIAKDTYGGTLVENIVQATARDCLAYSMINLDKQGYKIVMHVHDEVIVEIEKDSKDLDTLCDIMGEDIPWAKGLPLRADEYECSYYM
ncbi:DNA polymerase, partial [Peptoniphilus asaccharolyticus]